MKENKIKIAVIEDDSEVQELIRTFFSMKGYTVKTFDDSEVILNQIKSGSFLFDVIITDQNLPGMSGIEFTRYAIRMNCRTPIILITAELNVDTAVNALNVGAYDFVVKPIHFPQLLISVQRALHLNKIKEENHTLKTLVKTKEGIETDGIIAKSAGFKTALDLARRVANTNSNVVVLGESGTGKEVIARMIHFSGERKEKPFIPINCSAIPEELLESELFGYTKGAFTGATGNKAGLFEEAEGGTLFLDEIGDLSMSLQAKLLRVLQERKIKRLGENHLRDIDVRIVSATHKDLRTLITQNLFREDLYFRLNVIPIKIPPLRERKEDIIPLSNFFLKKFVTLNDSPVKGLSQGAIDFLHSHTWKGNVRELENCIERAVVLSQSEYLEVKDLYLMDESAGPTKENSQFNFGNMMQGGLMSLEKLTHDYIHYALKYNKGAKEKTAGDLGIDRKTLYRKLRESEQQETSLAS